MSNVDQESMTLKTNRSQQYFNKVNLFFYDFLLYGLISKYAWGSSIQRLDFHYKKYVRSNHLEVGVGTGFLLNRVVFDSIQPRLALMDLSHECLKKNKNQGFKVQTGNICSKSVGANSARYGKI